ncbi:LysR family transcriptional regulator [Streptomyces clavuligerus]|uniref:LysR family regulator n=1 Tax=Streptomyces clavuligerus TaxID=1901 RepID=B5GMP6_STRCL|nr:LysR family transcriptional regulator [Streptomyces clavuligerus]ACJ02378.1 LysR family regulator [Streptomyces clavuligerus]ANW22442.1 LysR family transcriptional regulator [Streptomyces clavuligerus]AXU17346.1 LysR family transcriptional regulator [Streptomyces clavuligerus]EDY47592.1 LysR-family transcriptional regulatory protein [Streptomyces clavuligerus]MBY6307001.1 LysR family transcriptional regulator [Streptomyces clavuligerus]
MNQVHVQEIECLLVLAEELHFGRTAERLGCSQSRVSQLVAGLERRIGVRLVDRTSRSVALSRFGTQFVEEVRPAYEALNTVITQARDRARSGTLGQLRIGFHGSVYEEVTEAFRRLRAHHRVALVPSEIPLGSPFTAVLEGRVDAVVVELPVNEPTLTTGFRFPPQERLLAVATRHPLAGGDRVHIEELATLDILHPLGDAPEYWRAARVPPATPGGVPIRSTAGITTVQEGLALVATGDQGLLVCRPLADRAVRDDVRFLPVDGLDEPSQLGLIWREDRTSWQLTTLARLLAEEFARSADAGRAAGCPSPDAGTDTATGSGTAAGTDTGIGTGIRTGTGTGTGARARTPNAPARV